MEALASQMDKEVVIRYYIEAAILPTLFGFVWLVLGYGGLSYAIPVGWGFASLGLLVFGPAWVVWNYYESKREQTNPQKL